MPILADCHLHSDFSEDSRTPMEEMADRGISLGLNAMCFTEHVDLGYHEPGKEPDGRFEADLAAYRDRLYACRDKYCRSILLLHGVELGMQPEYAGQNQELVQTYHFDFVIASSHLCHGIDPYYPAFYEGRSEEEAYREYFTSVLENLRVYDDFDVYGHLDYVVRYGPSKDRDYSYEKYRELIDPILIAILEKGKGIELNTGAIRHGLQELNPCTAVLRRYRELGGEIITVGSDAHSPEYICDGFSRASDILESCGFRYYTVFRERKPEFLPVRG